MITFLIQLFRVLCFWNEISADKSKQLLRVQWIFQTFQNKTNSIYVVTTLISKENIQLFTNWKYLFFLNFNLFIEMDAVKDANMITQ